MHAAAQRTTFFTDRRKLTSSRTFHILCFADRAASRYILIKKNQLDAQFIFSIYRQTPLLVSGISIPIIRRYTVYIQQLLLIVLFG